MNHRHADFQSAALPTELPGPLRYLATMAARRKVPQGRPPGKALAYRKSAAACRVPDAWATRLGDGLGNLAKFNTPVVANGKLYLATFSRQVAVYGLLSEGER